MYLRRNPKVAEAIARAEEELELAELKSFEEKMYGDIWRKEDYLNWMWENLSAIKSVMSQTGSIYVHLDWHIGHYVKVLMDEVFGEDNFINEIIVNRGRKKNLQGQFQTIAALGSEHDVVFIYKKSVETDYNHVRSEGRAAKAQWQAFWRGNVERTSMQYELLGFHPDRGQFLWKESRARAAVANYQKFVESGEEELEKYWNDTGKELEFVRSSPGRAYPEYWIAPKDAGMLGDVWTDIQAYSYSSDYATEKHEDLLARVLEMASAKSMRVADFFGGSGVTAAVAHKLGRSFIHADVGINSIQTTRDRLKGAGASFQILDIQDGVSLFRNPQQTMDKLKALIPGLRNEDSLPTFWEGAIQDPELGLTPVYIPNLLDHSTRMLDERTMNRILNVAIPELEGEPKAVVVYYIDIEDEDKLKKFIKETGNPLQRIILRDLKELLDEIVLNDECEFNVSVTEKKHSITITRFHSDRLSQKLAAWNQKKLLTSQGVLIGDEAEEGAAVSKRKSKPFIPITLSPEGLEAIELLSLDCTSGDGPWHSDKEIKIDKLGYVVHNGKKTKAFWDGTISADKKPLRLKVRNIAGDETIWPVSQ